MKIWIDWFEQGYQPRQHCRGFLKMTPGDGITRQFMQSRTPSIEAREGGGRNRAAGKSEIPISETRNGWKSDGQFFYYLLDVLQRHHWLGIVRVNDGWLVRRLAVYFFNPPSPRPYFWLWLPVFMIRWIDNLIWLNSAGSDYKDTSCILSGSFNCHDGICVIGDWSLRRIKTPRWCMRREMISESESGQNIMAGTELEKIKLFDFYRNWTMMLILVSAKLDLNI